MTDIGRAFRRRSAIVMELLWASAGQQPRALANKFGAQLTFLQGESSGTIDVIEQDQPESASEPFGFASTLAAVRAIAAFNRAYGRTLLNVWPGPDGLTNHACLSHSTVDPSGGSERWALRFVMSLSATVRGWNSSSTDCFGSLIRERSLRLFFCASSFCKKRKRGDRVACPDRPCFVMPKPFWPPCVI